MNCIKGQSITGTNTLAEEKILMPFCLPAYPKDNKFWIKSIT